MTYGTFASGRATLLATWRHRGESGGPGHGAGTGGGLPAARGGPRGRGRGGASILPRAFGPTRGRHPVTHSRRGLFGRRWVTQSVARNGAVLRWGRGECTPGGGRPQHLLPGSVSSSAGQDPRAGGRGCAGRSPYAGRGKTRTIGVLFRGRSGSPFPVRALLYRMTVARCLRRRTICRQPAGTGGGVPGANTAPPRPRRPRGIASPQSATRVGRVRGGGQRVEQ